MNIQAPSPRTKPSRSRSKGREATSGLTLSRYLAPLVGPPRQDSPSQAQFLCDSFLNWTLFGTNVLARGEVARAAEILRIVQDDLLKMARLLEGRTEHWITPTKCLESEISPGAYARYISCSAAVDRGALHTIGTSTFAPNVNDMLPNGRSTGIATSARAVAC